MTLRIPETPHQSQYRELFETARRKLLGAKEAEENPTFNWDSLSANQRYTCIWGHTTLLNFIPGILDSLDKIDYDFYRNKKQKYKNDVKTSVLDCFKRGEFTPGDIMATIFPDHPEALLIYHINEMSNTPDHEKTKRQLANKGWGRATPTTDTAYQRSTVTPKDLGIKRKKTMQNEYTKLNRFSLPFILMVSMKVKKTKKDGKGIE